MTPGGRFPHARRHLAASLPYELDVVEQAAQVHYRFPDHREDPYSYWVDTEQAAAILGGSAVRVRQLCAEGRIPFLLHAGVHTKRMMRRHQIEVIGVLERPSREGMATDMPTCSVRPNP